MIFVTLGSQKFQFDRLLKEIDRLCECGIIKEKVYAQTGESNYEPINYEYRKFMDRKEFQKYMDECETVITHGGTGAIITAIKKGKKVIAVPRLAKYGEHVDNHQVELAEVFKEKVNVIVVDDMNDLEKAIQESMTHKYGKWESNNKEMIESIDSDIRATIKF